MDMYDVTFYVDITDRGSILGALLGDADFAVTPNSNYPAPAPRMFKEVTAELLRFLDINPRCYITGPFSRKALQTMKLEKGPYAGTYVVVENRGGPALALSFVMPKEESDGKRLAPSHLTHAAKFWNEQLTQLVPASEELKSAFKSVRKLLQARCDKLQKPYNVWIGHSAARRFQSGELSLLIDGKWRRFEG
jgi:hypothetical protein